MGGGRSARPRREARRTGRSAADLGLQDGPEPLDLLLVVSGAVHRAAVGGGAVSGRGDDVRDGDGGEVALAPGVEHALGRAEIQSGQGRGEDGEREGLVAPHLRVGCAGAGLPVRRAVGDAPEEVENQLLGL